MAGLHIAVTHSGHTHLVCKLPCERVEGGLGSVVCVRRHLYRYACVGYTMWRKALNGLWTHTMWGYTMGGYAMCGFGGIVRVRRHLPQGGYTMWDYLNGWLDGWTTADG